MFPDYVNIESGRVFTNNDRGVVVLGYDAANELFGKNKLKTIILDNYIDYVI